MKVPIAICLNTYKSVTHYNIIQDRQFSKMNLYIYFYSNDINISRPLVLCSTMQTIVIQIQVPEQLKIYLLDCLYENLPL